MHKKVTRNYWTDEVMPQEDVSTNSNQNQRINYEFPPQFSSPDERDHSETMDVILTPPSPYQGAAFLCS